MGIFDSIVKENLGVSWCAPFETNRGCPYSCTFCDWGGLTQSKVKKFKLERVVSEIEWMRKNNVKVIFITDANFGIFKERDFEITKLLKTWIDEKNGLEYVHMNYAKNSNKHMIDIAEILGSASKGITLSVQTMNQDTLRIIKRENMKINNISEIMRLAKERNVQFYTELMLGLPEETLESWKSGFDQLLELGQHNRIEIFPVTLMENTELNSSQKVQYKLKSIPVENVVGWGKNESGIVEYYPTICETSTMTTLELVEGFSYYWMITNFHIIGYSQILSKYCRYVHNISYRKFYDKLFENIQKTVDNVSHHEYNKINSALISIYTTGKCGTADDKNSTITSTFHTTMYEFYANIKDILKISIETAKQFCEVDEGIIEIQKRFILNDVYEPNCTITSNFDIDTWEKSTSLYKIESSVPNLELNPDTIAIKIRRTKALRNKIYKINSTDI
jgi:radical SAM superfamily enzyme